MMTEMGIMGLILSISSVVLTLGIIFGIPMIWYHIGFVSRKLDKITQLMEKCCK
jgi:hypothetical protein